MALSIKVVKKESPPRGYQPADLRRWAADITRHFLWFVMRGRTFFEERLAAFEKHCPDIAAPVAQAYAQFARSQLSPEEFARIFNRADLEFSQRTGDTGVTYVPRAPRAQQPPAKKTQLTMVNRFPTLKLPLERTEDMETTLQALYEYAVGTIMDALRQVYKSREISKAFIIVPDEPDVLTQLKESARRDELAYNRMLKKRQREIEEEDEATRAQREQMGDMNDIAMSMLPKMEKVTMTTKRRTVSSKLPPGTVRVTKEDFIQALIHLKTHDGVLGRSRAVLKRLTIGI